MMDLFNPFPTFNFEKMNNNILGYYEDKNKNPIAYLKKDGILYFITTRKQRNEIKNLDEHQKILYKY